MHTLSLLKVSEFCALGLVLLLTNAPIITYQPSPARRFECLHEVFIPILGIFDLLALQVKCVVFLDISLVRGEQILKV